MATLRGIATKMKGSAGDFTFRRRAGQTVVSEKATSVTNARTSAQQRHRMKWANCVKMYKGISPLLNNAFENKAQGVTDYNMFMKVNMQRTPVYLTKSEAAGGTCIVAPYKITDGSLQAIVVTGEGSNRVTDISLGTLIISESTTVADFSNAVVQNNKGYDYKHQISFYDIRQRVNAASGIPYGYFNAYSVVLDKDNNATLWSVVDRLGFQSKGGFLGCGTINEDGAFCWVHSKKNKEGGTLVSPQELLDNNSLLASYTSLDSYYNAVETYGGEKDAFLTPNTDSVGRTSVVTNVNNPQTVVTKRTLTLSANPTAGGTVTGAGQYDSGTSANISATAATGYVFTKWSDNNTSANRTVVMDADKQLTATFVTTAGGEVTPDPDEEGESGNVR